MSFLKIFFLTLMLCFIVNCKKATKKGVVQPAPAVAVDKHKVLDMLQGEWELCTVSGGTEGDYKMTYNFLGNTLTYNEYYYTSMDGSCAGPLYHATYTATISFPSVYEESQIRIPINFGFISNFKIKALSTNTLASDKVKACSGLTSIIPQVNYLVITPHCTYFSAAPSDRNWKGLTSYSIIEFDYEAADPGFYLGVDAEQDGWTPENRFEFVLNVIFYKK